MNTSSVIGFSGSAAKRSIAAMVSSGNLTGISLFLEHRLPGIQRRAQSALATPTGAIMPETAEERRISAEDAAHHKVVESFCQKGSCANCHSLEGLQPGTLDGQPIQVCVNCRETPSENRVEASLPDFAALATEFGEPDASALPALYAAKGNDEAALRRSLGARRANRAKKAKAPAETN